MISSFQSLKRVAIAAALAAGAVASHAFTVGLPVTIDESSVVGVPAGVTNVVDQLSGQYDEVMTFIPTGATTGNFVTEAIFRAGAWFFDGSNLADSYLNAPGAAGYRVYAKFQATGSYSLVGSNFVFSGGTGALELWVDPDKNTTYNIKTTAVGDIANLTQSGTITDDYLLGSANSITFGDGSVAAGGGANGNFEILFSDFALTTGAAPADGDSYFTAPRPFYVYLDLNGNFQSFNPTAVTSVQLNNNSANAFFLPEPGAIGLAGLALVGAAAASRRRRA